MKLFELLLKAKNYALSGMIWILLVAEGRAQGGGGMGMTWVDRSPGITATWNGAAVGIDSVSGSQVFMVVGTNTALAEVATSPDGETWTRRPSGIGGIFHDVMFDGNRYVAVGTNSVLGVIGTSPDGVTWTSRTSGVGGELRGVVDSVHRGLVAVGGNSAQGKVVCSADGGVTWIEESLGGVAPLNSVESWLSTTIAVGVAGTMIKSSDGMDFTQMASLTANDLLDVTLHRDAQSGGWVWVAVGTNGAILVDNQLPGFETNGWTVVPSVTADHLHSVTSYGDLIVACGTDGRIVTTTDGINWTVSPSTSITANNLHAIAVGVSTAGGRFVAAGTTGAIFSADAAGSTGGGGPGQLDVTYTGPTSIASQGQTGLGFQVEALGADVYTEVFSSPWIRLLNGAPQTIPQGTTVAYAFEVLPQFYEAPRLGGIWVRGGQTVHHIALSQNGSTPQMPSWDGQVNTGSGLTETSIPLRWRDPTVGTVRGYRIEEEVPLGSGNWVLVATLPGTHRSFTHTGLQPWTRHHYRLFATNNNGPSLPAELYVQTVLAPPPNLAAVPDGWSRMRVRWSDVPGGREYILSRQIGTATTWDDVDTFGPGAGFHLDAGLPADTEVRYRMQLLSEVPQHTPPIQGVPSLSAQVFATARTPVYAGQIYWGNAVEESLAAPVQRNLSAVAFGSGKYVAVGQLGEILGSADGSNWTVEPEPDAAGSDYLDVAHGGGIWVIGGLNGRLLRSTGNGVWTAQVVAGLRNVQRVVYENGKFLAMAQLPGPFANGSFPGRLLESVDGVAWATVRDVPFGELAAGNGQFLTATSSGVEVSSDAQNWIVTGGTRRSSYAFGGTGGGQWVGVSGLDVSRSVDGLTWTDGVHGLGFEFLAWVRAGGGLFVSGLLGGRVSTTVDGISWGAPVVPLPGASFNDAAHGAQGWVAVGLGGAIVRSTDAVNWMVERPYLPGGAGSTFFVDGAACGAGGEVVAVSRTDGVWRRDPGTGLWSAMTFPNSPALDPARIAFVDGQFLVTGTGVPEDLLRSVDGINWTRQSVPAVGGGMARFASGGSELLGVGPALGGGTGIGVSVDRGASWTAGATNLSGNDIVFSNGEYFIAWDQGVLRSSDGVAWEGQSNRRGTGIASVIAGGLRTLVTVSETVGGAVGGTRVSVDGRDLGWTGGTFEAQDVISGDGVFVARKSTGQIFASLDGVNWEPMPAGLLSNTQQLAIAEGPGAEIGVASADAVVKRFEVSAQPLARGDADGVPDAVEDAAPNGGDGNNDGILDRLQANVASLPSGNGGGGYLSLVSPAGTVLANVRVVPNPSPGNAPVGVIFPFGILAFEVRGVAPGSSVTVDVHLPAGAVVSDYYKYGPEPGNTTDHWYDFGGDGSTGATFLPGIVRLTFIDGGRGDDDLQANGSIVDDGGPAQPIIVTPGVWTGSRPVMTYSALPGGEYQLEFTVATEAGVHYWLEASEDLLEFVILQEVIAVGSETWFLEVADPDSLPRRFYRVAECR